MLRCGESCSIVYARVPLIQDHTCAEKVEVLPSISIPVATFKKRDQIRVSIPQINECIRRRFFQQWLFIPAQTDGIISTVRGWRRLRIFDARTPCTTSSASSDGEGCFDDATDIEYFDRVLEFNSSSKGSDCRHNNCVNFGNRCFDSSPPSNYQGST